MLVQIMASTACKEKFLSDKLTLLCKLGKYKVMVIKTGQNVL